MHSAIATKRNNQSLAPTDESGCLTLLLGHRDGIIVHAERSAPDGEEANHDDDPANSNVAGNPVNGLAVFGQPFRHAPIQNQEASLAAPNASDLERLHDYTPLRSPDGGCKVCRRPVHDISRIDIIITQQTRQPNCCNDQIEGDL